MQRSKVNAVFGATHLRYQFDSASNQCFKYVSLKIVHRFIRQLSV